MKGRDGAASRISISEERTEDNCGLYHQQASNFSNFFLLWWFQKQVEFYFSLENLRKDKFLMKKMKNGTVPFDFVCGFPRLKKLTVDRQLIAHVVSKSKVVTLSQHGRRIGRRDHHGGAADLGFRLVEITNLPMDSSLESVTKLVEHFGTVVSIDFGWEGEHEATAAGNTPAHQHHQAFVEFKEAKAAVQVCLCATVWMYLL